MPSIEIAVPEVDLESVKDAQQFISAVLASPDCPLYTMNPDQLHGYLRAVAAEPQPTRSQDWMPLIFGGEIPRFVRDYGIEAITNALICIYNSHRAAVLNLQCDLPFSCKYTGNREARIQAEQWARGFMQGYIFWQEILDGYLAQNQTDSNRAVILPSLVNDELDDILAVVSAVADADYAVQMGFTLADLTLMFNRLPQVVIEYGRIAHVVRINSQN